MRFFLVTIIWVVIVGGMWGYVRQRDASIESVIAQKPIYTVSDLTFTLEITPTFSFEEDPFALETGNDSSKQMELKLNGQSVHTPNLQLIKGARYRVDNLPGVVVGQNEIYVKASPPTAESQLDQAIRVRLLQDSSVLVDKTIWNSQGSLVSGTITFEIHAETEDGHEHE